MTLSRAILTSLAAFAIALPVYASQNSSPQVNQPTMNKSSHEMTRKEWPNRKFSMQHEMKVNVNTADMPTLASLTGIGKRRAQAIIDFRDSHGRFDKLDQLAEVRGISKRFVDRNREILTIG